METEKKRQKRPTIQYYTIPASRSEKTVLPPKEDFRSDRKVLLPKELNDNRRNNNSNKGLKIGLSNDNNNNNSTCINRNVSYSQHNSSNSYTYISQRNNQNDCNVSSTALKDIQVVVYQDGKEGKGSATWTRDCSTIDDKDGYQHDNRFYNRNDEKTVETKMQEGRRKRQYSPVWKTDIQEDHVQCQDSPVRRVVLNNNPQINTEPVDINPCLTQKHRQISVDLSTLKTAVHRHMNAEILSQTLHHQIRMNRFFSLHRQTDVKVLSKAYRNKECCKEDYIEILKIVLRGILSGQNSRLSAEFCCDLIKKDVYRDKGDKLCIVTFLTAIEDLVMDHEAPCLNQDIWKKFVIFLAELYFLLEETVHICSRYLLPLISYSLNIMRCSVKCK